MTCAAGGHPVPSITWEKEGTALGDDSAGVVIISWNNGTTIQSHLLVAVTSDDRRGKYSCVASNKDGKTRQSFVIEGEGKVKSAYEPSGPSGQRLPQVSMLYDATRSISAPPWMGC